MKQFTICNNNLVNIRFTKRFTTTSQIQTKKKRFLKDIDNRREKMGELFIKLKMNTLEDWETISISQLTKYGGDNLLRYYKDKFDDFPLLYPNYPWKFDSLSIKNNIKEYENKRKIMDEIYKKSKLKSFEEWVKITRKKFIKNGGKKIIKEEENLFMNELKKLLLEIYPNFPWNFSNDFLLSRKKKIYSIEIQRKRMKELFIKFKLKSLDDWMNLLPSQRKILFEQKFYINEYKGKLIQLLQTIYPNHSWKHFSSKSPNIYYKSIENQQEFMEELFYKFNLKKLNDWLKIKSNKIMEFPGGKYLLLHRYHANFHRFLSSIYPNYPWQFFNLIKRKKKNNFKSIEKQKEFMDKLFIKFKLNSLNDWKNISREVIIKNGGKKLLKNYYNNDMKFLLLTLYPNFCWNFSHPSLKFKLIENQRLFMDKLYKKYNLNSLDDWMQFSISKFDYLISRNEIFDIYSRNIGDFLISIYPNYPWDLNELEKNRKLFFSIENQRKFIDNLFKKLKLNSFDDWIIITNEIIIQNGGGEFIKEFKFKFDLKKYFQFIYPNYPWEKMNFKSSFKDEYLLENQRKKMDNLFIKLNLNSFDEWMKISHKIINKIRSNDGNFILNYYKGDLEDLFRSIYPNYPWDLKELEKNRKLFFSIENQRKFVDNLFKKLNLNSFDDWINISNEIIIQNGGGEFIKEFKFKNDLKKYFQFIYPNYPWEKMNFNSLINNEEYLLENQRKKMDNLFIKFNLKSLNDWMKISRKNINKIRSNDGNLILNYYKGDLENFFQTIYPNYPWDFITDIKRSKKYFYSIENQKFYMDKLFKKLNLISLSEFLTISREKIIKIGGDRLLSLYNYQLNDLFQTIYPNFPWNLPYHDHFYIKIKEWINKYNVKQKKDWYRLPNDSKSKFDLYRTLKIIFPNENWKKLNFNTRKKKSSQRLLFSFTQKIYPSLLIFEDYFHPHLFRFNTNIFELDIFIPALQLAMEYQGQHHYDDLPGAFGAVESFKSRDELKEILSRDISIKLIHIPYWWDHSLESLQSSLQS